MEELDRAAEGKVWRVSESDDAPVEVVVGWSELDDRSALFG